MLPDLIKLSQELFELDMVDESFKIDEMISKLYGIGEINSHEALDAQDDRSDDTSALKNNLYDIIYENRLNKEFNYTLASIIYETLEPSDTKEILELLKDYLE